MMIMILYILSFNYKNKVFEIRHFGFGCVSGPLGDKKKTHPAGIGTICVCWVKKKLYFSLFTIFISNKLTSIIMYWKLLLLYLDCKKLFLLNFHSKTQFIEVVVEVKNDDPFCSHLTPLLKMLIRNVQSKKFYL